MADPLRIYAVEHPRAPRNLREHLEHQRMDLLMQLVSAQDWPDFTQRRGVIQGLDQAIDVCKQIDEAERA